MACTPMQWDDSAHAGFSTGAPWLAANPNYTEINVAADRAASHSVFRFYQRLIALRHENPAVALGRFELIEPDHEQLYAFTRTLDDQTLLVLANASEEPLTVLGEWLPDDISGAELLLGNYPGDGSAALRPWEARLYRL
jgi:oligo-1,6-glucosidase